MELNFLELIFTLKETLMNLKKYLTIRAWFIAHLFTKWDDSYDKLIQYSNIWSQIKYNNSEYHEEIHKMLSKITLGTKYELINHE